MKLQDGMLSASGRYSEGRIGTFRFIIGYYSRFVLGLLLRRNVYIIDQASAKLAEETNDERTSHV
jgi:hypothetical protein